MKKIFFTIVILAFSLCACKKEESIKEAPVEAQVVYHFSLQVSCESKTKSVTFDDDGVSIRSQFETTDNVYVYNETKQALARDASNSYKLAALHPSEISGSSCSLVGDLSFYKWNGASWDPITVDSDDTYSLCYQMNVTAYIGETLPFYDYSIQNGGRDDVSDYDFALATGVEMTVSGGTLTCPDGVLLSNLQSMFRQRLSFTKNGDPIEPSSFTLLSVSTKNGTLIDSYYPFDDSYKRGIVASSFPIVSATNDIYLSLAFKYDGEHTAAGDELIITLVDSEGNVYKGSKGGPSAGFATGKYYHGSMNMEWQGQNFAPTITPNSTENYSFFAPDEYSFDRSSNPNPTIITISGMSVGYYFTFGIQNTTISLVDGPAVYLGDESFIYSDCWPEDVGTESHRALTIVLSSNYTIDCRYNDIAIYAEDLLKLKTTGGSYTLTVTTDDEDIHGLYGDKNYYDSDSPVSALAADGFAVTRSETICNSDGSFTWVYTVTPKLYTVVAGDLGKVVGANGEIYDNAAAATAAGTSAEAMIAYVGSVDGVCEHGLAIALTDFTQEHDPDPYTTFQLATSITAAEASTPIPGGTWRLPTEKDWQYMIWGSYVNNRPISDVSGFISLLTTAGCTALVLNSYWTTSSIDADTVKGLQYDGTYAGFIALTKTDYWHVRACLSF